jgi:hypothetical protein
VSLTQQAAAAAETTQQTVLLVPTLAPKPLALIIKAFGADQARSWCWVSQEHVEA